MNYLTRFSIFLFLFGLTYNFSLQAQPCGKVDVGPAYIHVDVLESNKTIKRMDMAGIKADSTIMLFDKYGWNLKPNILYGRNGKDEELFVGALGIGYCVPLEKRIVATPIAGFTYSHIRAEFENELLTIMTGKTFFDERFHSYSAYLALEMTFTICEGWRISGLYQYSWSRTKTDIKGVLSTKDHAEGPNYALLLEYDLNKNWSVNVGGAYNTSLSHEKHGIRGAGAKIGTAYWF